MLINFREAIQRTVFHLSAVAGLIGYKPSHIEDLCSLGEETHNCGRRPIAIEFGGAGKIVYKPISLTTAATFNKVISFLASRYEFDLRVAECVLAAGDYGFMEYVHPRNTLRGRREIADFYSRAGTLLALAYALLLTDGYVALCPRRFLRLVISPSLRI